MADIELKEGGELTFEDETTVVHHQSRRKKKGNDEVDMDLNLTSMIDVIFQLLIYFILTITFIVDEGSLKSKLPGGGASPDDPEGEDFYITLTPQGDGGTVAINFDGRDYPSFEALRDVLENAYETQIDPEKDALIIEPDGDVRWNHVINAFNQCIYSNYTLVNFAPAG